MARTAIDDAADLAVADVLHKRFTALPASATIGDVRDWLAASSHRRMAVLADRGRYVGSLTRGDVAHELDPQRPASELAHYAPTAAPDAPARTGHELALSTEARRVPVVDGRRASGRCGRRDRRSGRLLRHLLGGWREADRLPGSACQSISCRTSPAKCRAPASRHHLDDAFGSAAGTQAVGLGCRSFPIPIMRLCAREVRENIDAVLIANPRH